MRITEMASTGDITISFTMTELCNIVTQTAMGRMVADRIYKEITENEDLQILIKEMVKKAISTMNLEEVVKQAVALALKAQVPSAIELEPKRPSYTCPLCGMTSYNPNDILYKYCGNCHFAPL